MRSLLTALCAAMLAAPALADPGDIPVAIGLPFAPETPAPLDPSHALYQGLAIDDVEGLPETIKSSSLNFIAAARRSSVNAALRESFRRMNFLAPTALAARKRLSVRWDGGRTPFHLGTHNLATVTFHYRLTRIDTGQLLFERSITTAASGGDADAAMRDNGIVHAAIAANFASAANCLDRAAYGTAPAECALTPKFAVSVVRERR